MSASSWSGANRLVDQAPVRRRGGVDGVARHGHFQRALAPHVAGHRDQRRVAEQARLAAGNREACGAGGHRQVTTGHQLAAAGRCQGVNPGHDRLGKGLDRGHHRGADLKKFARLRQRRPGHVGKIMARAEHRAIRRQDDAPRAARGQLAQGQGQFTHHVQGQGVASVDAVERHGGDGSVGADEQV